jgi:hypothetical protein
MPSQTSSEVTIATLTDAIADFIAAEGLENVDVVGSSMGARMVVELARQGHAGTVVALNPGGFWDDRQVKIFGTTIKASVGLVRRIQPALPTLTGDPIGRTALLAQFSAYPWKLPQNLVLNELRGFGNSPSLDAALKDLVHGPRQQGAPAGSLKAKLVIGWAAPGQGHLSQPSRACRPFVSRRNTALVLRLRSLSALGSARGDGGADPGRLQAECRSAGSLTARWSSGGAAATSWGCSPSSARRSDCGRPRTVTDRSLNMTEVPARFGCWDLRLLLSSDRRRPRARPAIRRSCAHS